MKRTILSCMPLVPTVIHWLLPVGIENRLYINLGGILPFFVFNLCYLFYILNYRKLVGKNSERIPRGVKFSTIVFSVCYLLYSLIHGFILDISNLFEQMLNNQALVFSFLLFMLYPMNRDMIERTKYIVIPTAVLLCVEVLLYSLGILQYSLELGTHESGGVFRISTTVGAATGTGVVLVMLGVMILYYNSLKMRSQFILVILITIAVFFLQSRGSIGTWTIFLGYYVYKRFLVYSSLKTKIRIVVLCLVSFICLFKIGIFNPIIERQKILMESGNMDTGRGNLEDKAFQAFKESGGLGIGIGQTNYEKSLHLVKINRSFPIGVHNHYWCVLAELGICGLVMLLLYFVCLMRFVDLRKIISIYVLLLLSLIFMTEPIFSYAEFAFPASFILMVSLKRKNTILNENLIIKV